MLHLLHIVRVLTEAVYGGKRGGTGIPWLHVALSENGTLGIHHPDKVEDVLDFISVTMASPLVYLNARGSLLPRFVSVPLTLGGILYHSLHR
jgi:hypothetical protein